MLFSEYFFLQKRNGNWEIGCFYYYYLLILYLFRSNCFVLEIFITTKTLFLHSDELNAIFWNKLKKIEINSKIIELSFIHTCFITSPQTNARSPAKNVKLKCIDYRTCIINTFELNTISMLYCYVYLLLERYKTYLGSLPSMYEWFIQIDYS